MGADSRRVVYQQTFKAIDPHAALEVLKNRARHMQPLLDRKQRIALIRIDRDRDDNPVKHLESSFDKVDMPIRDRIERARIDSDVGTAHDSTILDPAIPRAVDKK